MKHLLPFICVIVVGIFIVGSILSVFDAPAPCPCGTSCDCGEGSACTCPTPIPVEEVTYTISSLPEKPEVEKEPSEPTVVTDPCKKYHIGDTVEHPGKGRFVAEWKWHPEKSVVTTKPPIASSPSSTYSDDCPDGNCGTTERFFRFRRR